MCAEQSIFLPRLNELRRREISEGAVRAKVVVVDEPVLRSGSRGEEIRIAVWIEKFVSDAAVERFDVTDLRRFTRVDVMQPNVVFGHHLSIARLVNSGPLSNLTVSGRPRCHAIASNTRRTRIVGSEKSTSNARASRVKSSISVMMRLCRPFARVSCRKSTDHRSFVRPRRAGHFNVANVTHVTFTASTDLQLLCTIDAA
jgi:hypothetical protein